MINIPTSFVKKLPYVGPVISTVGLALDVKEIVENSTPMGAAKVITGRILKECTPPEVFLAGKCIMLGGGIVASIATGGNPLLVSGTVSAARSIIRN